MNLTLPLLLMLSVAEKPVSLFHGKTFAGWEGNTAKTCRIENGAIVGGSTETVVPRNEDR